MYDINLNWHEFQVFVPAVQTAVTSLITSTSIVGVSCDSDLTIHCEMEPTQEEITVVQAYWDAITESSIEATSYNTGKLLVETKAKMAASRIFADDLINQFAAENLILSITADNMVENILTAMTPTMNALTSGSLTVAISRLKSIPQESYDAKYITAQRILSYVNKIETFLQLPHSTSLS